MHLVKSRFENTQNILFLIINVENESRIDNFFAYANCNFCLHRQAERGVPGSAAAGLALAGDPRRGWLWSGGACADSRRQLEVVRSQADEEGADRGDTTAAAHYVGEAYNGRGRLRLHRQALQDVQGPQVPLYADGGLSRG